jgi:hypothetical protein
MSSPETYLNNARAGGITGLVCGAVLGPAAGLGGSAVRGILGEAGAEMTAGAMAKGMLLFGTWSGLDNSLRQMMEGRSDPVETAEAFAGGAALGGAFALAGKVAGNISKNAPPRPGAKGTLAVGQVKGLGKTGGVARAEQYSSGWANGSLKNTVNKIAPDAQPVTTESGKFIYSNPLTDKQVVYDIEGNYFRIENTSLQGKRVYTDINGNAIPNNKIIDGREIGVPQSEYNQLTHFNNTDTTP